MFATVTINSTTLVITERMREPKPGAQTPHDVILMDQYDGPSDIQSVPRELDARHVLAGFLAQGDGTVNLFTELFPEFQT